MLRRFLERGLVNRYIIILPAVLLAIVAMPVVANVAHADSENEIGRGQTRDICEFQSRVDNPHISRNRTDVSGHGWWNAIAGTCPSHARVQSWLYQWTCDAIGNNCSWIEIDDDDRTLLPGGGAGKRTNVRRTCASSSSTGYKNLVDVDLIGFIDPPTQFYRIKNVNCRVLSNGYPYPNG